MLRKKILNIKSPTRVLWLFTNKKPNACCRFFSSFSVNGSNHGTILLGKRKPKYYNPPDVKVFNEVITEEEETNLVKEVDSVFKYIKYDASHFDQVINHYREKQLSKFTLFNNQATIDRIYSLLKRELRLEHFEMPHIIDLFPSKGVISKHVDSVKYGGGTVSGLSLLSSRVMRLMDSPEEKNDDDCYVDVVIPRRSLYSLCNDARYQMSHAIPSGGERRISIIFRDQPELPKWMKKNRQNNATTPKQNKELEFDEKLEICKACEFSSEPINNIPTICKVCNCPIAFRAFMGAPCPKNKW